MVVLIDNSAARTSILETIWPQLWPIKAFIKIQNYTDHSCSYLGDCCFGFSGSLLLVWYQSRSELMKMFDLETKIIN